MVFTANLLGANWRVAAMPSPAPKELLALLLHSAWAYMGYGAALPSNLQARGGWYFCSIFTGLVGELIRQADSAWNMFLKKVIILCVHPLIFSNLPFIAYLYIISALMLNAK